MPSFIAPDGTPLVYDVYEPPPPAPLVSPPAAPRAAVLMLHGWSDHAGRWTHVAEHVRDAGFAAYVLDQRGHGRSGGRRGHLSRFSQLLGDLQAFRRAVRLRSDRPVPQVLFGHSFGGLVALRYLETQPGDPLAAAIVSAPALGLAFQPPMWKLLLGRLLEDLWPTLALGTGIDTDHLSRDPAINAAYEADAAVHDLMTAGAWRELQWARRAVVADGDRIDTPLLFLLAGEDRISDAQLARAFADALKTRVQVRWYPEMYHELLNDPQRDQVLGDILAFLAQQSGA